MKRTLVTLTGPSCSGKTTLKNLLIDSGWKGLVSFTTRGMRPGEAYGKDYYFLTPTEFFALRPEDMAEHIEFNGNHYGLLSSEMTLSGHAGPFIDVVEPNGVRQLNRWCQENGMHHLAVFIDCPMKLMFERFLSRFNGDNPSLLPVYASRLEMMVSVEREWRNAVKYDLIFDRFAPDTQTDVVNTLINHVENNK